MNPAINSQKYKRLYQLIFDLYHLEENKSKLLFHGWHHIKFVHDKSIEFAKELNAKLEIVASAALVHDLNYVFTDKLEPEAADSQIKNYLHLAGFNDNNVKIILETIENAHIGYRDNKKLSLESQSLADGDTLFKALPITPIIFASRYLTQNRKNIGELAHKVVEEQEPLMLKEKYFYTGLAKSKYLKWAQANLNMWKNVLESLNDESVIELLRNAKNLGVI